VFCFTYSALIGTPLYSLAIDMQKQFPEIKIPGGLHEGEEVLVFLRRHWFVMLLNGFLFLFLMLLPYIIYQLIPANFFALIDGTLWQGIMVMFLGVYYLSMWLFFFAALVDYYLDVWIVTNERIIDVQQVSLFRHVVAEQRIVRVQDVTSSVRGIFPTFLNFGDVNIQTAGEAPRFTFQQVPDPERVKNIILAAYEAAVGTAEAENVASEERRELGQSNANF